MRPQPPVMMRNTIHTISTYFAVNLFDENFKVKEIGIILLCRPDHGVTPAHNCRRHGKSQDRTRAITFSRRMSDQREKKPRKIPGPLIRILFRHLPISITASAWSWSLRGFPGGRNRCLTPRLYLIRWRRPIRHCARLHS